MRTPRLPLQLVCDPDGQRFVAPDEARIDALRFAGHLDRLEAFQHLFPNDPKLKFGQPQTYASMNAEPK